MRHTVFQFSYSQKTLEEEEEKFPHFPSLFIFAGKFLILSENDRTELHGRDRLRELLRPHRRPPRRLLRRWRGHRSRPQARGEPVHQHLVDDSVRVAPRLRLGLFRQQRLRPLRRTLCSGKFPISFRIFLTSNKWNNLILDVISSNYGVVFFVQTLPAWQSRVKEIKVARDCRVFNSGRASFFVVCSWGYPCV